MSDRYGRSSDYYPSSYRTETRRPSRGVSPLGESRFEQPFRYRTRDEDNSGYGQIHYTERRPLDLLTASFTPAGYEEPSTSTYTRRTSTRRRRSSNDYGASGIDLSGYSGETYEPTRRSRRDRGADLSEAMQGIGLSDAYYSSQPAWSSDLSRFHEPSTSRRTRERTYQPSYTAPSDNLADYFEPSSSRRTATRSYETAYVEPSSNLADYYEPSSRRRTIRARSPVSSFYPSEDWPSEGVSSLRRSNATRRFRHLD